MNVSRIEISRLCDLYGALLSEKQRNALEMYCNEDLTLSEIAENTGISRQGVRDQIKHAEAQLLLFENTLGLSERYGQVGVLLEKLARSEALQNDPEAKSILQSVRELLNLD